MNDDKLQALLSGYASSTLTSAEQDELFALALEQQDVFDELLKEQTLRETLDDPQVRSRLLAQLQSVRKSTGKWNLGWLRLGLPAAAVLLLVGVFSLNLWRKSETPKPQPSMPEQQVTAVLAPPEPKSPTSDRAPGSPAVVKIRPVPRPPVKSLPETSQPLSEPAVIAEKRIEAPALATPSPSPPPPPAAKPLADSVKKDVDAYNILSISPREIFQSQLGSQRAVTQTVEVTPTAPRLRNPFKLGKAKVAPPPVPVGAENPAIRVSVHMAGQPADLDWRAIPSAASQSLAIQVDTVTPGYIAVLEGERTLAAGSAVTFAGGSVRVPLSNAVEQISVIYSPTPLTPARIREIQQGSTRQSEEAHDGSEHAVYAGATGPARELTARLTVNFI